MAMFPNLNLFFFSFTIFLLRLRPSAAAQASVKAAYWFPESEFPAAQINSALFTHLFYAFAALNSSNQTTIPAVNQAACAAFTATVQRQNPSLKTLLSIGGSKSNPASFSSLVSRPASRKSFIDSSIKLARANGFHGLDLDWQYPETPSEMDDLGALLAEWRAAVSSESQRTGQPQLLLTAAVYFSPDRDSATYPVVSVAANLDWVNSMAYDFKGPGWSGNATGAPAALYDPFTRFSGSAGVEAWISYGLPAKKLVLGMTFFGYAWRLVDARKHGLGAAASGRSTEEGVNEDDGSMRYREIKQFVSRREAMCVFDGKVATDYCYAGSTWIGFDGPATIAAKVGYARRMGLLGYYAWHVGGDSNWELSQKGFDLLSTGISMLVIIVG